MQEQLKPAKSINQIAAKHGVSPSVIRRQIVMGTSVEKEHTKNKHTAMKIALQHVEELPNYYTKLKKMETKKITENHKEVASGKMKDEEGYMANVEFDQIERSINVLRKVIKKSNQQIPAWVQSKITRAADFIDTAADYMQSDENVSESVKRIQTSGQLYSIMIMFLSKTYTLKMYFPSPQVPSRDEVNDAVQKVYPGGKVLAYYPCMTSTNSGYVVANEENVAEASPFSSDFEVRKSSGAGALTPAAASQLGQKAIDLQKKKAAAVGLPNLSPGSGMVRTADSYEPEGDEIQENTILDTPEKRRKNYLLNIGVIGETAAWTRKDGKNKKGGLNERGRKSYESENPGSDLKAPSKKVGNPRRASFCARMSGMKTKLTSKKTANDPNSRINKSLRAWNC